MRVDTLDRNRYWKLGMGSEEEADGGVVALTPVWGWRTPGGGEGAVPFTASCWGV